MRPPQKIVALRGQFLWLANCRGAESDCTGSGWTSTSLTLQLVPLLFRRPELFDACGGLRFSLVAWNGCRVGQEFCVNTWRDWIPTWGFRWLRCSAQNAGRLEWQLVSVPTISCLPASAVTRCSHSPLDPSYAPGQQRQLPWRLSAAQHREPWIPRPLLGVGQVGQVGQVGKLGSHSRSAWRAKIYSRPRGRVRKIFWRRKMLVGVAHQRARRVPRRRPKTSLNRLCTAWFHLSVWSP